MDRFLYQSRLNPPSAYHRTLRVVSLAGTLYLESAGYVSNDRAEPDVAEKKGNTGDVPID